jgi:hypothetical protein
MCGVSGSIGIGTALLKFEKGFMDIRKDVKGSVEMDMLGNGRMEFQESDHPRDSPR